MAGIFINYRSDAAAWAVMLDRELSDRFGGDRVFRASRSIQPGEDFIDRILRSVRSSSVLLALIGPTWLATDSYGRRRIDDETDWVRREIAEALAAGVPIIPILTDNAAPLDAAQLPTDIARLGRCQYLRLHYRSTDSDLQRILDALTSLAPALMSQSLSGNAQASVIAQLKRNLSDHRQRNTVRDVIHTATTRALSVLGEPRYPISTPGLADDTVPAALEERLNSYERDMEHLLRLVATGVYLGNNRHDELWIGTVNRVLNRRDESASSSQQHWIATEDYPALLLTYVIGIAGRAADLDVIIYRQLTHTTGPADQPALCVLALYRVVDPKYASAFPKWNGVRYYHALSVHLRQALRSIFDDLLDDHEYATAFEEYEYLRSLLEIHYAPFASPLGEFAYYLHKGRTTVHERMRAHLTANGPLLQAGAFDGDIANVDKARHQLESSIRGRYL